MFGKRISLAASATFLGVSFLVAQPPPSSPPTNPAAPLPVTPPPAGQVGQTNPGLPGTPQGPSQSQGTTLPGQTTQPGLPAAPAPGQTNQSNPLPGQVNPLPGQVNPLPGQTNPQPGQTPLPRSIDNSQNRDNSQQPSEDAQFVVKAGECDLAEINIGRIAAQRASRPEIRQFANQLVQDHTANLNRLNEMANRNRWKVAERMDQEHQQLFQKLAGMQGQDFDREFVSKMVDGHKKVAEMYQNASQNCKNADLKSFATQTLATIRQHEQAVQRLNGQNPQAQPNQTPTSAEQNDANRPDGNRPDANRNDNNNRQDNGQPRPQDR